MLATLGGELLLDLGRHLAKRLDTAVLHVGDLDGVVAEGRAHGLGRHLPFLQREYRFLELRHHLALANKAEIAALGCRRGIFRQLLGQLAEVLAGLDPSYRLLDLGLGLVLGLAATGGRHAHQDVRGLEPLRLLELCPMLLVISLGIRLGHRLGEGLGSEQDVLDPAALRLAELRLMGLHVRFRVGVADRDLGHERTALHIGPVRAHALEARRVRLVHFGRGHLDAVLDERFHLLAQQVAAHLGLEFPGLDALLLEQGQVPVAGKAPVVLKSGDRLDAEPQLFVADGDALALGLLDDERLLDEVADGLLVQAHALGHLRRDVLAVRATIVLDVVPLHALEASGRNILAVDGGGRARACAVTPEGARAVEEERRRDERDDHDQEDELQPPEVFPHGSDQHDGLPGTFTSLPGSASSLPQAAEGTSRAARHPQAPARREGASG